MKELKDNYREKRINLINELRRHEELDPNVLDAMLTIKREFFMNPIHASRAYDDSALPIDCNQTISQPYTVAFMTSLLKIEQSMKTLEIGTGSGYQSAVLVALGARVHTIERHRQLHENAKKRFEELGLQIMTSCGDGTLGWKLYSPYQRIIVTAAAPNIPEKLKLQLAVGGRLVVPVGDKDTQKMYLIERISESNFRETPKQFFKFVPLIGADGWKE
ncbi:MAG: protein-L-isoaspartate(D-aspartate) O-methyltransferase [Candidatus Kapabacteria bacterium]|nr:protein-L-isoaspartate(D-aspartate) O-methyltransferase [Candidatus Kapabacteria bacterium]